MKILDNILKTLGEDKIFAVTEVRIEASSLLFINEMKQPYCGVIRKDLAAAWYSDGIVTFVFEDQARGVPPCRRVQPMNSETRAVIAQYLVNLGGTSLPDNDESDELLLWEKPKLKNKTDHWQICCFEHYKDKIFLYAGGGFLALLAGAFLIWRTENYLWLLLIIPSVFCAFIFGWCYYVLLRRYAADLKNIGIPPRWFGKTVNPNAKLRPKHKKKARGIGSNTETEAKP